MAATLKSYHTRCVLSCQNQSNNGRNSIGPPADSRGVKADAWIVPDDAANFLKRMYSVFCKLWSSKDDGTKRDWDIAGYSSNILDKYGPA